jgi:chemotaxis family two-component system response regulator Rcp1
MATTHQNYQVLLVEDNPGDERLVREAFKAANANVIITSASNGAEALALLRRTRPDLILLDLNLPMVDGREVLQEVKHDKRLRHIPVIILTSSVMPQDVLAAYRAGANCYMQKPMDLASLFARIRELIEFWTRTAILPPQSDGV